MNFPVIRLEIERMKETIMIAISEHQVQMDKDIKEAIDQYCSPENISCVIHSATREVLDSVIKQEVKNFFTYGDGRKAVAQAVRESILKNETYTVLDREKNHVIREEK